MSLQQIYLEKQKQTHEMASKPEIKKNQLEDR
jgi:hypothetical protein